MRRATTQALLLLSLSCGPACASESAPRSAPGELAVGGEASEGRPSLDPDLYRSVLVIDVEAVRRLDPRAPRDAILSDVVGADPLLRALLPHGFRSLADIRRIEYRARGFAATSWGLLVRFDRSVEEALAARGLGSPAPHAAAELPGARPTLGAPAEMDELLVAPAASLDEEQRVAASAAPVTLGPDDLAAWRLTHVDEEFRGQEEALPREVWLRARRFTAPALVRLEVRARYPDGPSVEAGHHYWESTRRRLAANAWVALAGLDRPLGEGRVVKQGREIAFVTTLRAPELRLVLAAVAAMHGRPEVE